MPVNFAENKVTYSHHYIVELRRNKTETSIYLRLKKRKVFKIVKGFFENPVCSYISKNLKWGPFGDKKSHKIFRKKSQVAQCQKIQRGEPIVSPGFVS